MVHHHSADSWYTCSDNQKHQGTWETTSCLSRFEGTETPQNHVVWGCLMCVIHPELRHSGTLPMYLVVPCCIGNDDRGGSIQSNHPGLKGLNHPELMWIYPVCPCYLSTADGPCAVRVTMVWVPCLTRWCDHLGTSPLKSIWVHYSQFSNPCNRLDWSWSLQSTHFILEWITYLGRMISDYNLCPLQPVKYSSSSD